MDRCRLGGDAGGTPREARRRVVAGWGRRSDGSRGAPRRRDRVLGLLRGTFRLSGVPIRGLAASRFRGRLDQDSARAERGGRLRAGTGPCRCHSRASVDRSACSSTANRWRLRDVVDRRLPDCSSRWPCRRECPRSRGAGRWPPGTSVCRGLPTFCGRCPVDRVDDCHGQRSRTRFHLGDRRVGDGFSGGGEAQRCCPFPRGRNTRNRRAWR